MCTSRQNDSLLSVHAYGIGYRLTAIDPNTRTEFTRTFISMQAALEQGIVLSGSGYHIEIWSPDFLEVPETTSVH
jgi:hypothetical protein